MNNQNELDIAKHLEEEHKITPLSAYLKEIVYGGNDGIITTFAVVAGFAGAQVSVGTQLPVLSVLIFGFANLFGDGVSMALGNLLSTRSEQDVYANEKKKELYEIIHNTEMERIESVQILITKGFTKPQAEQLISIYSTNPKYWVDFMMNQELELPNPEKDDPYKMSLVTFCSFITFGFIPLIPYVFFQGKFLFIASIFMTAFSLFLIGIMRWRVSKQGFVRSVGEMLLLGGAAATVAYLVGTMFRV
jgi:VIT1/CCC1 family predicted Fe2+/Mn2+ transporter